MKSYDKATWHIDGGEAASEVVKRFREVFEFLYDKNLLNEDGKETLEYGMDSSVSLNSSMVKMKGTAFLDNYYDIAIKKDSSKIRENLEIAYKEFLEKIDKGRT